VAPPSQHEALSSNPSTIKKEKRERERERNRAWSFPRSLRERPQSEVLAKPSKDLVSALLTVLLEML
jgi:hypothetical protein